MTRFGYSKADYEALTLTERAVIMKEYENMTVSESTLTRNAVMNAVGNVLRKKGKPFRKLWIKNAGRADKEQVRADLKTVMAIEKKEAGWIEAVYKAAGVKRK